MQPNNAPLRHLTKSITKTNMYDPKNPKIIKNLITTLNHNNINLIKTIHQSHIKPNTNILILINQFKKIFQFHHTKTNNKKQTSNFINLLLKTNTQQEISIYMIITIQSNYLNNYTEFHNLTKTVNKKKYLIPHLTHNQIHSYIENPIQINNNQIAFSLTQKLLNNVNNDQNQLPILQHSLIQTFDH